MKSLPARILLVSAYILLSCSPTLGVSIAERTGRDIPALPDPETFLRSWMVIGPFPVAPYREGEPAPESWAEEAIDVPRLWRTSGNLEGQEWREITAPDGTPKVTLEDKLSPNENVSAYAAVHLWTERQCDRRLLLGSDDGVAVWLNGKRLFQKYVTRATRLDEDSVPVRLRAGHNLLVLKVVQGASGWDFAARLDNNSGISWSLSLPGKRSALLDPSTLPATFEIWPYVQRPGSDTMTVLWQADKPSRAHVRITGGGQSQTFRTRSSRRLGSVTISGLKPSTDYAYQVALLDSAGRTCEQISGDSWRFRTFPDKRGPVTFVACGDSRSRPELFAQVCEAIAREKAVTHVLHTGDIVADGNNLAQWLPQYFKPASVLIRSVPLLASLGNHEGDSPYYYDYSALRHNERHYSYDVADAHFVVLDSNEDFAEGSPQYEWLVADLEEHRSARWKFVNLHHPVFTSGSHGSVDSQGRPKERGIRTAQDVLPELARRYGIQAVFSGHDHAYERSEKDGVLYIVTGGAGAPFYGDPNREHNPYRKHFRSGLHYCVVSLNGGSGRLVAKTPDGEVFDAVDLRQEAPFGR